MISIISRDKNDLDIDYNVQSEKFGILIGYTYNIFVLTNQISNSYQTLRQNKFYENQVNVAQVIRIKNFSFFAI